jgi:hypothetical protein
VSSTNVASDISSDELDTESPLKTDRDRQSKNESRTDASNSETSKSGTKASSNIQGPVEASDVSSSDGMGGSEAKKKKELKPISFKIKPVASRRPGPLAGLPLTAVDEDVDVSEEKESSDSSDGEGDTTTSTEVTPVSAITPAQAHSTEVVVSKQPDLPVVPVSASSLLRQQVAVIDSAIDEIRTAAEKSTAASSSAKEPAAKSAIADIYSPSQVTIAHFRQIMLK